MLAIIKAGYTAILLFVVYASAYRRYLQQR